MKALFCPKRSLIQREKLHRSLLAGMYKDGKLVLNRRKVSAGSGMPELKTRALFISHAWNYEHHYNQLVLWFDGASNFSWRNCSLPSSDGLEDKTSEGLSEGMTRQISPAQGVIILAGMYAAHSDWIQYEISEALRMNKVIIGVRPWGAERVPTSVQDAADVMVNWQSASIIQAVRDYV